VKAEREARYLSTRQDGKPQKAGGLRAFWKEWNSAFRQNWFLFVYMVVLMSGMNSVSHGSQDLYPTFLLDQVRFDPTQVTVTTVVGQIGALIGSTTIGYFSTFTGRRLIMMTACVFGGAIVPAYIFPRNDDLIASTFFEQFFVGGVWGPIPIHLIELSPPHIRTLFYSFTYQLGNLASAASSTIEATIGQRFPLPNGPDGESRYDYGKVIGIFLGAVWVYILVFIFLGPEMTQSERDEEAAASFEYERLRAEGVSLAEIGAGKVKIQKVDGEIKAQHIDDIESGEHKSATDEEGIATSPREKI
jgi:SHS family lactate transporter-like MFS transporter